MSNIAARMSGFGRPSKKSVGKHPVQCPPPAIGGGKKVIVVRNCPKDVSRIWFDRVDSNIY